MRWMMLAAAIVAACASPASAQKIIYGSRTPTHRATYNPRDESVMHFAGDTQATAAVGEGCTSCNRGGCASGGCAAEGCASGCCSSGKSRCCSVLPNLIDNIADVFVAFKPCPTKCGPCVRPVHACPYPRTCPPSNCCKPRLPTILDTIFVCNKRGCNKGCGKSCGAAVTTGCTSCAAGAPVGLQGEIPAQELLTPPSPPAVMKDSPFGDDPMPPRKEAARRAPYKTTSRSWYKTIPRRPTIAAGHDAPETVTFGNASPIALHE